MISETLSESDFAEQLNIRIWEKLSKFNWMPFEEARETIRKLNLKNQKVRLEKNLIKKIYLFLEQCLVLAFISVEYRGSLIH